MSQKAYNTITLRRLPSGETVQISFSYNRSLTILVNNRDHTKQSPDIVNGTVADISSASFQGFIITPNIFTTTGNAVTLSLVKWTVGSDDKDAASLTSYMKVDNNTGALTIFKSPIAAGMGLIEPSNLAPLTLTFEATVYSNGHPYTVRKQTNLDVPEVSENSYWGSIVSNQGTTLGITSASGSTIDSVTLTPHLYLNTDEVTTGVTYKWYKTGAGTNGSDLLLSNANGKNGSTTMWSLDGNNLTVTREGVDSAAHFECHFFTDSDGEVEAEGVAITDVADQYQVVLKGDPYASENTSPTILVQVYDVKNDSEVSADNFTATAICSDSLRQRTYNSGVYSLTKKNNVWTFTMNEAKWRVPYNDPQSSVNDWCTVGDKSSEDKPTTDISKATKCEVILLVECEITI